jgi:hypothetical protein
MNIKKTVVSYSPGAIGQIIEDRAFVAENFNQTISGYPEIGREVEFVPRWGSGIIRGLYGDRGFYEVGKVWGDSLDVAYWRYVDE